MMPFTMFMVNICGWNCKSPSISHNAPSMRWSAFRESNMKMSQPFNSIQETDVCKEIACISSSSKALGASQPEPGQDGCEPTSSEDTADRPCCLLGGITIFHPRVYSRG